MENLSLEEIKQIIETMEDRHHVVIGSLLKKNNQVKLNENKSGTLVNLSLIPTETIYEIKQYLSYVMDQENTLSKIECATEEYKQFISHEKDNKDNFGIIITP